MVVTKHAKERALERLIGFISVPTDEMYTYAERLLIEAIKPCGHITIIGSKYYARIEGHDSFRAVIQVSKDGIHTIKTIIPIKDMK